MATDRDIVESAFLSARAEFLEFVQTTQESYNLGNVQTALGIIDHKLGQLPPDVQAKSRALNPQQWAAVDARNKSRKLPGG